MVVALLHVYRIQRGANKLLSIVPEDSLSSQKVLPSVFGEYDVRDSVLLRFGFWPGLKNTRSSCMILKRTVFSLRMIQTLWCYENPLHFTSSRLLDIYRQGTTAVSTYLSARYLVQIITGNSGTNRMQNETRQ